MVVSLDSPFVRAADKLLRFNIALAKVVPIGCRAKSGGGSSRDRGIRCSKIAQGMEPVVMKFVPGAAGSIRLTALTIQHN
jgi:hypothetical protein